MHEAQVYTRQKILLLHTHFVPLSEQIKEMMNQKEDRTYKLFVGQDHQYIKAIWSHIFQSTDLQHLDIIGKVIQFTQERQQKIQLELMSEQIFIETNNGLNPFTDHQSQKIVSRLNKLKGQTNILKNAIINLDKQLQDIVYQHKDKEDNKAQTSQQLIENQQKKKQFEDFLRKQKIIKQKRLNTILQQKQKQQQRQIKIKQQQKVNHEKLEQEKKQKILKKKKKNDLIREKQKSERLMRNQQYKRIKKRISDHPPIFLEMEKKSRLRYQSTQMNQIDKIKSQRTSIYTPFDRISIDEHSKQYQKNKQLKEEQRKRKRQKLLQIQHELQNDWRNKYHSSYDLKQDIVPDKQQQIKILARQKVQKINSYQENVKRYHLPKVDEEKKKQLMNLIQDMELRSKKIKRIQLKSGSVIYEELKPADPRMMGIEYLQKVKELTANFKRQFKKSDNQIIQKPENKVINYLEQQREKSLKKSRKKQNQQKLFFNDNLSYEQKVKKVESYTQQLAEKTKQAQMKLKFGKFKTSDEILQCKQEIDQNYLDIVNIKLKLAHAANQQK